MLSKAERSRRRRAERQRRYRANKARRELERQPFVLDPDAPDYGTPEYEARVRQQIVDGLVSAARGQRPTPPAATAPTDRTEAAEPTAAALPPIRRPDPYVFNTATDKRRPSFWDCIDPGGTVITLTTHPRQPFRSPPVTEPEPPSEFEIEEEKRRLSGR